MVGHVIAHEVYPVAAVTFPRRVTVVPVAVPARVHPAVVKAAAVDAVHVFSTAAPAALMLNPADGAQQTA